MRILKLIMVTALIFIPIRNSYSGFGGSTEIGIMNTDLISGINIPGADVIPQLTSYYDLRQRKSYIQVTNISNSAITTHVQIFQHDRKCDELNFNDELTPGDTVIYDMDDILRNDGSEVPVDLADDSYGYVVISIGDGSSGLIQARSEAIIGNVRIIDNAGYEYRVNMAGIDLISAVFPGFFSYIANFNTLDGANLADVVGYSYYFSTNDDPNFFTSTVRNLDVDLPYNIFVYDLDEEPLSCDQRAFTCGNVMNYGINENYLNSRGGPLLCPGGGLADPDGGFISLELSDIDENTLPDDLLSGFSIGAIGLNNNDGTGSFDYWIIDRFVVASSDIRLKNDIDLVHTLDNGIKLYSFKYNENVTKDETAFVGVMAQDLLELGYENAVVIMPDGYYAVNYNKLGLRMVTNEEWEKNGLKSVMISN